MTTARKEWDPSALITTLMDLREEVEAFKVETSRRREVSLGRPFPVPGVS
jgi:hypothetical protein